jgi:hypothetical protein
MSSEVDDLKRQVAHLLSLLGQMDANGQARSISQFCARNNISRSFFYVLKKRGKAPRIMNVDGRQIISPEAERDWRMERENAAAAESARRPSLEPKDRTRENWENSPIHAPAPRPRSPPKMKRTDEAENDPQDLKGAHAIRQRPVRPIGEKAQNNR